MTYLLSYIGTLASIGSIPLAIYLFLKSREERVNKIKLEIVKTLLFHLNDSKNISTFEIQSIINSKLRENRISENKIKILEVIEILIFEIISNPLLNKEDKKFFIASLKSLAAPQTNEKIISKATINPVSEGRDIFDSTMSDIEDSTKRLLEFIAKEDIRIENRYYLSTQFGFSSLIIIIIVAIFIIFKLHLLSLDIKNIFGNQPLEFIVVASFSITLFSLVLAVIIRAFKFKNKKKAVNNSKL
jgi:hypothetical protein